MRILTKEQLKRAEDILTYMYIQNLQEGKGLEDCISMNRKIQWLSKVVLGKKAKDIPDMAHDIMRRRLYENKTKEERISS